MNLIGREVNVLEYGERPDGEGFGFLKDSVKYSGVFVGFGQFADIENGSGNSMTECLIYCPNTSRVTNEPLTACVFVQTNKEKQFTKAIQLLRDLYVCMKVEKGTSCAAVLKDVDKFLKETQYI